MSFATYLSLAQEEINSELESFFEKWLEEVENESPLLRPLIKEFQIACQGGKRIRGTLVKLGYELGGGSFPSDILLPAIALEINQTAILAHDDIIDQSKLRRGKPTLHQALGGDHYAISQTIALGDIGFFQAFRLLESSNFAPEYKNKALRIFADSMLKTGLGESLDIALSLQKKPTEQEVLTMLRLKTAYYTFIGPLQLGASLAGVSDDVFEAIQAFGQPLGMVYQLYDDIQGCFGEEDTIGKTVGSDIREGKATLLIIKARERATPQQLNFLDTYYGSSESGEKEIKEIQNIFEETGSLLYSQDMIKQYMHEVKKSISMVTKDQEKRELLEEMTNYFVHM